MVLAFLDLTQTESLSCQVGALLSALFDCHRPFAVTDATNAPKALSVPVKPCIQRCAA